MNRRNFIAGLAAALMLPACLRAKTALESGKIAPLPAALEPRIFGRPGDVIAAGDAVVIDAEEKIRKASRYGDYPAGVVFSADASPWNVQFDTISFKLRR